MYKDIGDRLKCLRTEKGLKQSDISDLLNIKRQTYSAWERNISNPDLDAIKVLADYFDVTTDYLLGLDDKIETIAAHHEGEDYTKEELEQIEAFKAFVRSKRENKDNRGD